MPIETNDHEKYVRLIEKRRMAKIKLLKEISKLDTDQGFINSLLELIENVYIPDR